VNWLVTL